MGGEEPSLANVIVPATTREQEPNETAAQSRHTSVPGIIEGTIERQATWTLSDSP